MTNYGARYGQHVRMNLLAKLWRDELITCKFKFNRLVTYNNLRKFIITENPRNGFVIEVVWSNLPQ